MAGRSKLFLVSSFSYLGALQLQQNSDLLRTQLLYGRVSDEAGYQLIAPTARHNDGRHRWHGARPPLTEAEKIKWLLPEG